MAALLSILGDFYIYFTGVVLPASEGEVSHEAFLDTYSRYVADLQAGRTPEETLYRRMFSTLFTRSLDAIYALDVGKEQIIIRPSHPVVQLQMHQVGFSSVDHKFRSMVFGKESLSWGIQFSYPQLFEDGVTKQIIQVNRSDAFPNSHLFHELQKWVRKHTVPTPFLFHNQKINVPIRLGLSCFEWIQRHPHLEKHGLTVQR